MSVDYSSRLIDLLWSHGVIWDNATMTWTDSQIEEHIVDLGDGLAITDTRAAEIAKMISQPFSVGEQFDRVVVVSRGFNESVTLTGEFAKLFYKNNEESIQLDEAIAKASSKALTESANVVESETDPTDYRRHYYETFHVADAIVKHLTKNKAHNIGVVSSFIGPNVPAVLSDVAIKNTIIEDSDIDPLTSKGSAFGFSDWMPFVDGEYYYREALFKMTVRNESRGSIDSVKIPAHKFTVDVYEIFDKGIASISTAAEGTRIDFNKVFRESPDPSQPSPVVVITPKEIPDGFCVPEIVSVAQDHMYVRLIKPDNSLAQGTVMWSAVGF